MTRPCRVTLVAPTSHAAGSERALLALATGLRDAGIAVTAAVAEDGPLTTWLTDANIPLLRLPRLRARNVSSLVRAGHRIRVSHRGEQFVVIGSGAKGHLVGTMAVRAGRGAAIWWQHGTPDRSWPERWAATRRAAGVIAVSQFVAERHRAAYPKNDVRCIHPGVRVEDVRCHKGRGARIRTELGWDKVPIVGVVGRLQRWKGQDAFIRMAAAVTVDAPGTRFMVVGGPVGETLDDYEFELRQSATSRALDGRLHFAGHVEDAYAWIDAMDIVVNTSIEEPFGLVVVEAMALGKPVIAWRSGGPAEIIEDGRSGTLVPAGDEEALIAVVRSLLSDRARANDLGTHAAERANSFDVSATTPLFLDLLDRVARSEALEEPDRA